MGWRKRQMVEAQIYSEEELNKAFDEKYIKYREAFPKREYVMPVDRNEVLEEVAKAVYDFKAFEKDTMDSFATYIRSLKRWTKKRPVRCADSALQKLKARTVGALNSGAVLHAMN